jgi:hypothetical protein
VKLEAFVSNTFGERIQLDTLDIVDILDRKSAVVVWAKEFGEEGQMLGGRGRSQEQMRGPDLKNRNLDLKYKP